MVISMIENGCRVGFFGLGRSSAALLEYLPLKKCRITLRSDTNISWSAIPCGAKIERIYAGKSAYRDIDEDVIIFSPSVRRDKPELLAARERGVIFTSDAELFFDRVNKPLFAVTGSDGKSTTATLVSMLLSAGGVDNSLIGNIGTPMLPELKGPDAFVLELSSFMLTYGRPKAKRGCITNITPNHLDWHKDYEEYKKTKISLAKSCEELVITDQLSELKGAYGIVSDKQDFGSLRRLYDAEIYVTLEDGYILKNGEKMTHISNIKRNENHNLKNAMMAITMTDTYVDKDAIAHTLKNFEGLAHRCERVMSVSGMDFYDSSIDSTPKRTAMTLESLKKQVVLILGGRSKGLDFKELIPSVKKYAELVIITGENAREIYSSIGNEANAIIIESFEEAIKAGASAVKNAQALVLSPASTSYDLFHNYAERGDRFKAILQEIYGK